MVLDTGGFANAHSCGIRQGGAFELKQATWAYSHALESPEAEADENLQRAIAAESICDWFQRMPWGKDRSPVRWTPNYEAYLLEQWQNGSFDAFWQKPDLWAAGHYDAIAKIPIAFMSSWYDVHVASTLDKRPVCDVSARMGRLPPNVSVVGAQRGQDTAISSRLDPFGQSATARCPKGSRRRVGQGAGRHVSCTNTPDKRTHSITRPDDQKFLANRAASTKKG